MEDRMETGQIPFGYACDADLFERVWERVGARERGDCPVEPGRKEVFEEKCDAEPVEGGTERVWGNDFPAEDDLPCLGKRSAEYGGQLQKYIMEELHCWQLYRHLARRVSGPNARSLAALASEKHRRARKLATAHFLIAGVRYWPVDELDTPRIVSWLGTLREQFAQEQRSQHRYRAAAYDTEDPCLSELYSELAGGCGTHAALLRKVLEGAL